MTVKELTDYAKSFTGKVKYVFGGNDVKNGQLDCSSYIQAVYRKAGVELPRTTQEQAKIGTYVKPEDAKEGDMVMFQNTYTNGISHVGYYLGGGKVLHNSSNGITISDLTSGYYAEHFSQFRRVLDDKTMAAVNVSGVENSGEDVLLNGGIWYVVVRMVIIALAILFGLLFFAKSMNLEV